MHFVERHADAEGIGHVEDAFGTGFADFMHDLFTIARNRRKAILACFQTAQSLLEGFLESRADSHHFAHGLHLGSQTIVCLGELLESKTRHLGDHVVNRGFEGRRRCAARDIVFEFVERIAHGKLGSDLGNRKARGLGSKGRGTRHARIHFDDDQTSVLRIDGKLNIRAAGVHANFSQHGNGSVAQQLSV